MSKRLSRLFVVSGFLAAVTPMKTADAGFGRFFKKVSHGVTGVANTVAKGTTGAANTVANGTTGAANTVAKGTTKVAGTIAKEAASDVSKTTKFTTSTMHTVGEGTVDTFNIAVNGAKGAFENLDDDLQKFANQVNHYFVGGLEAELRRLFDKLLGQYSFVTKRLRTCSLALLRSGSATGKLFAKAIENKTEDSETASLIAKFKASKEYNACVSNDLRSAASPLMGGSSKAKVSANDALSTFAFQSFSFGLLMEASAPIVGGEASIGFVVDMGSPNQFKGWLGVEGTVATETSPGGSGSVQAAFWKSNAAKIGGPSLSMEISIPVDDIDYGTQIYFNFDPKKLKGIFKGHFDVSEIFQFAGIGASAGVGVGGKQQPVAAIGAGYTWILPHVK